MSKRNAVYLIYAGQNLAYLRIVQITPCCPLENRCLNPRWLDDLRWETGDVDNDQDPDSDYALLANSTIDAGSCSPIEFHSGLLFKVARKCPNLKTLTLVECLMGYVDEEEDDADDDDDEEVEGESDADSASGDGVDSDDGYDVEAKNINCGKSARAPFASLENLNFKWCEAGGQNFCGAEWYEWITFLTSYTPNLRALSFVDCFDGGMGKCGLSTHKM